MHRKCNSSLAARLLAGRATRLMPLGVLAAVAGQAYGQIQPQAATPVFTPSNLVLSRSVYSAPSSTIVVGKTILPGCTVTSKVPSCAAIQDATYPYVFNNISLDASFGITSPIYLDEMSLTGSILSTMEVPNASTGATNGLVTSFSSKSEEALHLSTDGQYVVFADYVAPLNSLDASNSNTPLAPDPTNPVPNTIQTYRAAATVNAAGQYTFTETNAYSGNNPRAAIYVDTGSTNNVPNNFFYTVGNAGNGSTPEPPNVVLGAGLQLIPYNGGVNESAQTPGAPTPVGSFNVSELQGVPATTDKVGKDDNFRGITIYNNVVYVTKGSGGNGVNTVYFVDTVGGACPNGMGLPIPGAPLPTSPLAFSSTSSTGLPDNMCILNGFPTAVNKLVNPVAYPFGLFFASPTVLYVADEGDGVNTYSGGTYTDAASAVNPGGLQKWILTGNTWSLAYTLKTGLNLGIPYTVTGYPTGLNSGAGGTGLPWAPATDGLRQIVGTVGGNRFTGSIVTIWATSSTVSGSGDQGADPNKLYVINDKLTNTSAAVAAQETFTDLRDAQAGEVLRGVTLTPGTPILTSY